MNGEAFLRALSDTCRELIHDAVNGISVCPKFEDATLIGFMQLHQLLGLRRLMLPLAAQFSVTAMAESVFDQYLNQLEDIKNGSRSLLQVPYATAKHTSRSSAPSAL